MAENRDSPTRALRAEDVPRWDQSVDVVVVGHGGAGASAAIEAARAGAETLVLERATRGGGTTALSTGVVYFGGGTRVQRACGFDDPLPEMLKAVRAAAGRRADEDKVRAYCENSVEHFDWFCDLGIAFKDSYVAEKTTHPFEDDCLFYSGNELAHPFADSAAPAPRGHKPMHPGEAGGFLMESFLKATSEAGIGVRNECRAERAIQRADGRVLGMVVMHEKERGYIKARRAVILCAGGFIENEEMVTQHAPHLLQCNYKCATPNDDGLGIRIGIGAGGNTMNMHEGLVLNAYYPPASNLKGILVDAQGRRFINEDAYLGRTSDAILMKADGRAWLIVDDDCYGRTQGFHKLAAVEETIEGLERALGMPEGQLVATVATYNANSNRDSDPLFHKHADYLKPLSSPPYAALDCCTSNSFFGVLTLGGLATDADSRVLTPEHEPVPGLFAAGRNAAGLCLEGRTYASGLSIGDATFFGRVAGRNAAALSPWE
jgi:succinate dehydrogenase/fumarate reductase flavoprotein subunit